MKMTTAISHYTEITDNYRQRRGNMSVATEFEDVTGYYGNI